MQHGVLQNVRRSSAYFVPVARRAHTAISGGFRLLWQRWLEDLLELIRRKAELSPRRRILGQCGWASSGAATR